MGWKKYISIGISALLALGAGLSTIKSQDVKVGISGEGARLNTLGKVGTVLKDLAPYMCQIESENNVLDWLDFIDIQLQAQGLEEEKEPTYTSAKITIKTFFSEEAVEIFETVTYYISPEAVYVVFDVEQMLQQTANWRAQGDIYDFRAIYSACRTEIYMDEDYSLIRFSDALDLREVYHTMEVDGKSEKIHKFEMVNIPVGLEEGVWYSIEELNRYEYSLPATICNEEALSTVGSFILDNEKEFEYYGKDMPMNDINAENWWYVFLSNGANYLDVVTTEGDVNYQTITTDGVEVYMADTQNPVIIFNHNVNGDGVNNWAYYQSWTKIELENVNATTVKKLKAPKIGKVDVEALEEALREEYNNELD